VTVNAPAPEPPLPEPLPATVTVNEPLAPAKPDVPELIAMVPLPLALDVAVSTCSKRVGDAVSVPVSVPVILPVVTVRLTGMIPCSVVALVKLKLELNVPLPVRPPVKLTVPVAVMLPLALFPLPVIAMVVLMVAACAATQRSASAMIPWNIFFIEPFLLPPHDPQEHRTANRSEGELANVYSPK
jgi:hypothetical protein